MLFCLISLVGTASAEDTSNNELVRYDASIDMSEMETSSAVEVSSLNSNSNDVSNVVSNVNDTAESESQNRVLGSSLDESDGMLSASHDLSGSTLQDIQNYLDSGSVVAGDTIYLGNQTWNSGNWGPWDANQVVKVNIPNLIISGGTSGSPNDFATISAGSKIFQLNAPGITLKNIAFTNTAQGPCCAVNIQSSDSTITNCVFDHCYNQNGAAIYGSSSSSNTKIENCNFTNNEAIWGGKGTVYYEGSDLTISNSIFDANIGGAVYSDGDTEITDSIFENHNGQNTIVILQGTSKVTNSNFTNNDVTGWETGALNVGGENSLIENCNFINNSAQGYGGAVAVNGINSQIKDSTFTNNHATNGGAIHDSASGLTVNNCAFENNTANSGGGAIDLSYDKAVVSDCNFTNNSANGQGGAIYIGWDCNNQTITNCDFTDNDAGSQGGAIYADSEGNKVTYSNFTGNSAPNGGAIQLGGDSDDFDLEHVTFENNHAYVYQGEWGPVGGHGGAINADNHNEINPDIVDVTFINNTADIAGGAVKHHSNWTFNDCEFINNSANPDNNPSYVSDEISFGGGALWCCDGISNLINTDFIGNNATFGGAIRGAVNAKDCLVENNTAFNGNGGGIDMTIEEGLFNNETFLTAVNVKDCTFINNSAQGDYQPSEEAKGGKAQGGAIHVYRVDGMVLDNITCIDNSAYRGGAIDLYVMNFTTVVNSTILNNTATLGGGIAVVGNHTLFDNVNMTDNHAIESDDDVGQGGGIWVIGEDCKILNSTINDNDAEGYGGGAWILGSDVCVNDTVLDNNYVTGDGGGIYVEGDGCIFNNNTISNNTAEYDYYGSGGGIAVEGDNCIFTNNNISFNTARYGGGVIVYGSDTNFTHNELISNTAETGGGFYVNGDDLHVEDLYAYNNTAENGGGCAVANCDGLTIINSTFDNNTAVGNISLDRGEGGAIHMSDAHNALIQADFINNTACNGSAIYVDSYKNLSTSDVKVVNSTFFDNQAWSYMLNITPENNTYLEEGQEFNISVSHQGGDNIINAIYNDKDCTTILNNVTYPFMTWDGQLINKTTPTEDIRPVIGAENSNYGNLLYQDDFENNQIINVLVKDKDGNVVVDKNGTVLSFEGLKTDIFGNIFFIKNGTLYRNIPVAGLGPGRYYVEAIHPEDRYYKQIYNFTVLRVGPTDLEINKTVSNATCNVDDIVDWNVTTGNIGPIDAENVTIKDTLPEGLDLLNLTFNFVDSINGNWCTGKLDLSTNILTYGVYNKTADAWTYADASYDGAGTWNIVIPDIDGNKDILKPVTIKLTLNKATTTTVSLFVSDLLEDSSVVMNLVTNVTKKGVFTNFANVTTDTPETNYTNNNATNTTRTDVELINLTVNKVWDDKDNQDGVRPVNVTIGLYANGVKINETVLSAENNWTYTFTDLPVNENGQIINYTVNETPITNYTTVITNETAYNWTVTNNHTPLVTELNVTKVWDDNNNQDGVRPPSVVVELFADGVKINEIVLSEENGWKWTFPDLAVYKNNGSLIVYTVNETAVANYTAVVTNASAYDWTVTNNHTPLVTELNVTKVWDDNNNQDGVRPPSVVVELFADGVKINEIVLSEENGWKWTFPDLAVYKNNGSLIVYTVNETAVANYTAVVTNASAYDWTVTNNHTPLVTELNVTKVWDDNNNQDGVRPPSVVVELFADGVKINEIVLSEENGWKWTFPDLAVYKNNGSLIVYTVNETAVANYTAVVTNASAYDWTVTNNHTPLVTELNVTKVWDDNNNQDGVRPPSVVVELFADGVKINEIVLSEENGWKWTFPDLAVYKNNGSLIVYTVNETAVANYTAVVTNASAYDWTVTNNHTPLVTELNVTKVWDDNNNQDGVRPPSVVVELFADGVKINEIVLSEENGWKWTFPDLAVYKNNGSLIVYTVNETAVANYTAVVTNASAYDWTVTNNHTPLVTELNVTKVWDDNNNQDGVRPPSVVVELFADGVKINEIVLSEENGWKWTFPDLAVYKNNGSLIVYTVNETAVANYTAVVTNASAYDWTVTNNHTPIVTELNVTKVWVDADNQDGVRPVSVTVELFADGVKINETVLNADNDWKFTFPDLAVYKNNGTLIVYTVNETAVANYTAVITNASAYDWTVTNNHTPIVTELNVTKVWVDADNQDGVRPVSVTVELFADGVKINEAVLNGDNDWKWTFPNLPVYKDGVVIKYTVNETAVANYTAVITNASAYDWTVTNNHTPIVTELNVTKVWDDNDDQDKIRPENVTVYLYADGVKINETVLNADNDWKFTFPDLAVYSNGQVINYTIGEAAVANYTVVITNATAYDWTVTNKHTHIDVPNMTVQKIANDVIVYVGNQTSFTIVVTNNGECNLSDVKVTETWFSEGLEFNGVWTNGSREWTYNGAKVWTLKGILENGTSASFNVFFNVTKNGTLVNNVSAVSNLTNETNGTNQTKAYLPNMTVEKITYEETVYVGDQAIFTIFVKNTGDCDLSNVTVTETWFSDGLVFDDWVPNGDRRWNYDDATRTWTLVGVLNTTDPLASFVVYFNVTKNGTLHNNVSAKSNLTNETNATNKTKAYLPNMTVQKVTLDKEVYVGNTARFTIVVENTGDCVLDKVYVVDTDYDHSGLAYRKYENGSRNWNYDGNGNWTLIGALAVGEKANFTVWFEVLTNGTFVNNVSAGSNLTNETNGTNNTTGKPICDLGIVKIVNATNCNIGDLVEWNITIMNHGPSAASNVIVKDVLPNGLELVDYKVDVGIFTKGINEWSVGTLEKDTPVSLILVTKVLIDGTFLNIATVNTTTPESDYTNNEANNTTVADPICDLVISKIVNASKVYKGDLVKWTIKVTNNGPSTALNVKVRDVLPDGLKFVSYKASQGKYQNGVWTIGKLTNGSSATLTLITKTTKVGNITNFASASTDTPESNYSNNEANNTTEVINEPLPPSCDLVIYKSSDKTKYHVNDVMHWIIKVVNNGPDGAKGVYVKDALPVSTKFIKYSASKGSFDAAKGVWKIGDLDYGEEVTLIITCRVLSSGSITNEAVVNSSTVDTNVSNNYDNATIIVKADNPPVPNPIEPKTNGIDLSLKTGNPLLLVLLAFLSIFTVIGIKHREE